ncbi:MAG: hypothetical protein K2Y21_00890 [Phycisphaerales bacterium]|nr:hypothetical protein [Phycisphaerales bacterium]
MLTARAISGRCFSRSHSGGREGARGWVASTCLLTLACLIPACASADRSTDNTPVVSAAPNASAPTSLDAAVVYRAAPWTKNYREGKRLVRREAKPAETSLSTVQTWTIDEYETRDATLQGALVRRTTLERSAEGAVFLKQLDLAAEGRILTFDPALVLMPATLTKPCVSTADVTMSDSKGQNKTRGTATQTTTLLGTKDGLLRLESELVAKFDFTTVDRTAILDIDPAKGIVRETQERVVKVGLFNLSRNTQTVTLVAEDEK